MGEATVAACDSSGPVSDAASLASPKSSTLTRPSRVTITFAGLRSRCTTPFSCAATKASASGIPRSSTWASGNPPGSDELGEAPPFHQLHGEEPDAAVLLDGVEHHDVRVVEPGHGRRLALEASEAVGRRRHVGGQHLDRDVALEARVARTVDLAHPSRAERRDDLSRVRGGTRRSVAWRKCTPEFADRTGPRDWPPWSSRHGIVTSGVTPACAGWRHVAKHRSRAASRRESRNPGRVRAAALGPGAAQELEPRAYLPRRWAPTSRAWSTRTRGGRCCSIRQSASPTAMRP